MSLRLDDEDRRAVDLLLERANGVGDTPAVEQLFQAPVALTFENRIDAVDRLLELLNHLPAEDPPADLVTRTLQRIAESESSAKVDVIPVRSRTQSPRPHA